MSWCYWDAQGEIKCFRGTDEPFVAIGNPVTPHVDDDELATIVTTNPTNKSTTNTTSTTNFSGPRALSGLAPELKSIDVTTGGVVVAIVKFGNAEASIRAYVASARDDLPYDPTTWTWTDGYQQTLTPGNADSLCKSRPMADFGALAKTGTVSEVAYASRFTADGTMFDVELTLPASGLSSRPQKLHATGVAPPYRTVASLKEKPRPAEILRALKNFYAKEERRGIAASVYTFPVDEYVPPTNMQILRVDSITFAVYLPRVTDDDNATFTVQGYVRYQKNNHKYDKYGKYDRKQIDWIWLKSTDTPTSWPAPFIKRGSWSTTLPDA